MMLEKSVNDGLPVTLVRLTMGILVFFTVMAGMVFGDTCIQRCQRGDWDPFSACMCTRPGSSTATNVQNVPADVPETEQDQVDAEASVEGCLYQCQVTGQGPACIGACLGMFNFSGAGVTGILPGNERESKGSAIPNEQPSRQIMPTAPPGSVPLWDLACSVDPENPLCRSYGLPQQGGESAPTCKLTASYISGGRKISTSRISPTERTFKPDEIPWSYELEISGIATSAQINSNPVSPSGGTFKLHFPESPAMARVSGPGGESTCTLAATATFSEKVDNCSQAAADAFCRERGWKGASGFTQYPDVLPCILYANCPRRAHPDRGRCSSVSCQP